MIYKFKLQFQHKDGFSGEEVFSPLTNLALRKFDRQYYDSKICQIPKRTKNQANF